jgi:hypothetical protein
VFAEGGGMQQPAIHAGSNSTLKQGVEKKLVLLDWENLFLVKKRTHRGHHEQEKKQKKKIKKG